MKNKHYGSSDSIKAASQSIIPALLQALTILIEHRLYTACENLFYGGRTGLSVTLARVTLARPSPLSNY